MNQKGTDIKIRVTAARQDIDLDTMDFSIIVLDRYGRTVRRIQPDDYFHDSQGGLYFTLENMPHGIFFAHFTIFIPDDDYVKQTRRLTDMQYLTEVGMCGCGKAARHSGCSHPVIFEQVEVVSVDNQQYLADIDGNYILTADGQRIVFNPTTNNNNSMSKVTLNMTGEEFKQLIEGHTDNGVTDTIPEAFDNIKGNSDRIDDLDEQLADFATEEDVRGIVRDYE